MEESDKFKNPEVISYNQTQGNKTEIDREKPKTLIKGGLKSIDSVNAGFNRRFSIGKREKNCNLSGDWNGRDSNAIGKRRMGGGGITFEDLVRWIDGEVLAAVVCGGISGGVSHGRFVSELQIRERERDGESER